MSKDLLVWVANITFMKTVFALTANTITTSGEYLLLLSNIEFLIVLVRMQICLSTMPFDHGDFTEVAFRIILFQNNCSAMYKTKRLFNSPPLSEEIMLVAPNIVGYQLFNEGIYNFLLSL